MNHYNNNLLFLKKYVNPLFGVLKQSKAIYAFDLQETENENNCSLTYKGKTCYANSRFHQFEEFEDMFANIDINVKSIVLIGVGNGEVFEYIKNKYHNLESVFVIEPFLGMLKRLVRKLDIQRMTEGLGNVSFIINQNGKDSVHSVMSILAHNYNDTGFVCHASYFSLLDTWLQEFEEEFVKNIKIFKIHYTTVHYSKYQWLKNNIYNLRYFERKQEELMSFLYGKPVILVSAGPSLNKHLDTLKAIRDQVIIVAAGTAIRNLSAAGIKPHFQIAVDRNNTELIYDEAFYNNASEIPLIYTGTFSGTVLEKYNGPKYFMLLTTDVLGKYVVEDLKIPMKSIQTGSSVVIPAFDFLYKAGCSSIILVGQDMCFYDNELYAKGRVKNQKEYDDNLLIKTKDIFGNDVNTLNTFIQIKYDYESVIKDLDQTRIINATEGGLGIEGAVNRSLEDVINVELKNASTIDINDLLCIDSSEAETKSGDIEKCMLDIVYQLGCIRSINKDTLEKIKKVTAVRGAGEPLEAVQTELAQTEHDYNESLSAYKFYMEVIQKLMQVQVMALKNKYTSKMNTLEQSIIDKELFLCNICAEIDIMCEALNSWIEDAHFSQ